MSGPLALVYPALAQVLWTLILITWNGRVRIRALRGRRVRFADIALDSDAYPDDVRKISNNMHNQFETPLLFFVLLGIATYIGATNPLMVVLAWLYFATRVAHTAVHTTTNYIPHRFYAFLVGIIALILMWIAIVAHLLAA
jgi:hypothetical protein